MTFPLHIENILREKGIYSDETTVHEDTHGSVRGVYELQTGEKNLFIKIRPRQLIKNEVQFLQSHSTPLLPKIIAEDMDVGYYIMTKTSGARAKYTGDFGVLLTSIVKNFINLYHPIESPDYYGYPDAPKHSFYEFVLDELQRRKRKLLEIITPAQFSYLESLTIKHFSEPHQPYRLHGDLGLHNVFFKGDHLSGIIDPGCLVGYPVWDFMFFAASNPADISIDELENAFVYLHVTSGFSARDLSDLFTLHTAIRYYNSGLYHPTDQRFYADKLLGLLR